MAMFATSSSRLRDQSSFSSTASSSGSPSTITVAKDSMVGCRNATVAVSVTPVVLDVAGHRDRVTGGEAELDHRNRLVDRVGDCPVAFATQLRSHSRISGTDCSVRLAGFRAW